MRFSRVWLWNLLVLFSHRRAIFLNMHPAHTRIKRKELWKTWNRKVEFHILSSSPELRLCLNQLENHLLHVISVTRAKQKIFLFFLLYRPPDYKRTLHNLLRHSICFKLSQTASLTAVFSVRFDHLLQLVSVSF